MDPVYQDVLELQLLRHRDIMYITWKYLYENIFQRLNTKDHSAIKYIATGK